MASRQLGSHLQKYGNGASITLQRVNRHKPQQILTDNSFPAICKKYQFRMSTVATRSHIYELCNYCLSSILIICTLRTNKHWWRRDFHHNKWPKKVGNCNSVAMAAGMTVLRLCKTKWIIDRSVSRFTNLNVSAYQWSLNYSLNHGVECQSQK